MAKIDLIIDIGSSNINIYKSGEGLVLREPSVAILSNGKNIVAFGLDAKEMMARLPQNCQAVCPIQEGSIKYYKMTQSMLDDFISRAVRRSEYFFKPKVRVFANIPCGCSKEEKKMFENMLYECDAREVYLVEAPIMALYGATSKTPISKYIVDIGGGITDIAYIQNGKILFGKSYGIGGINIDKGIVESIENAYSMQIGLSSAEKIKQEIGTLFSYESNEINVYGKNILTGKLKEQLVGTDSIRGMIEFFYGKIADIILESFRGFSDETIGKIKQDGIVVLGGGSGIHGLQEFLQERLDVPVSIPEKPSVCSVLGGGKLLEDPEMFNKILNIKED